MLEAPVREVTVLAAGGTIGMSPKGEGGAVPSLDADALVQAVPALAKVAGLRARTVNTRPNVQVTAADAPANLFDAVVVAGAAGAEGLGVLVSFAGAVHAARAVRKADSTAPDAFASPRLGPIGRVQEGRAWMARRVERFPPVPVASLEATVHIVPAGLAADGSLVDAAVEAGALRAARAARRPPP